MDSECRAIFGNQLMAKKNGDQKRNDVDVLDVRVRI